MANGNEVIETMNAEMALPTAAGETGNQAPSATRIRAVLGHVGRSGLLAGLLYAAWSVRVQGLYDSNSDFAYYLGVTGGLLMLALLLYPLRKRLRLLGNFGPLRHWFRFHMLAGLLGPLLVLFHSTFQVRSLNAAVALGSMLLVALSGIVGRFIYRHIHRGLYGRKADLEELSKTLERRLAEMASALEGLPEVAREIARFAQLVREVPANRWQRLPHFLLLGTRRRLAGLRTRRALARHAARAPVSQHAISLAEMKELIRNIDITLQAAQKAAQFSTYERLFSLWHAVHIPFLCMLVITAVVHVFAVHAY